MGLLSGLSPRGRGNHPLYARAAGIRHTRVYPRVGGGTIPFFVHVASRVRPGSIPAWAGEPSLHRVPEFASANGVYPRVGGGTWNIRYRLLSSAPVYPRVGGGTRAPCTPCQHGRNRSIPAWAGEPLSATIDLNMGW